LNKNGGRKKKDSNIEIRIEGKDPQPSGTSAKKGPEKNTEESFDKKANAKIDVSDIEKIVFSKIANVKLNEMHKGVYNDPTVA
jgi:hypothetical protein